MRLALALLSMVSAACSGAGSLDAGTDSKDAETRDGGGEPSDAAAQDARATACDAGPPLDMYATSQPFECNESLQTITTRSGSAGPVTLSFDLVVPTRGSPTAIVILLPGGAGALHLTSEGIGSGGDNFCVRTRQTYAAAGFVVAVPDVPSDHLDGGLDNFRATQDHAADLSGLIQHLRARYNLPVTLVSTSRGTISATNVIARFRAPLGPDHVVLTSSVTTIPDGKNPPSDKEDIQSVPDYLNKLASALPILMIDEAKDVCGASPPLSGPGGAGAQALAAAIGDAEHFVLVDGGAMPPVGSDVCGGVAYHGFYGEDADVVSKIITFIQAP